MWHPAPPVTGPTLRAVSESPLRRAADKITWLSARPSDLVTLWRDATEVLADAVPFYGAPCWYTMDPASLLITSHVNTEMPEFPAEWLAEEYYSDDLHQLIDVVSCQRGISTLHEATGGDPTSSSRWQENIKMGGDQELIVGLRTRSGDVWGALGLYREPDRPLFDAAEQRFLLAVAPRLAEGARRALLVGEATDPEGPDAPGLVILSERWEVESTTPGLGRWLAELPDGDWDSGRLPSAVLSVAARARRSAENPDQPGEVAVARVLSRGGTWVVLHGTALVSPGAKLTAIIVEPAHPARIYPLLMSAYGLTERERDLTRLILQGNPTVQIAEELVVSAHGAAAPQDHLPHSRRAQPPRPGRQGLLRTPRTAVPGERAPGRRGEAGARRTRPSSKVTPTWDVTTAARCPAISCQTSTASAQGPPGDETGYVPPCGPRSTVSSSVKPTSTSPSMAASVAWAQQAGATPAAFQPRTTFASCRSGGDTHEPPRVRMVVYSGLR